MHISCWLSPGGVNVSAVGVLNFEYAIEITGLQGTTYVSFKMKLRDSQKLEQEYKIDYICRFSHILLVPRMLHSDL